MRRKRGVSVIVCTCDGADRLPPVLEALSRQEDSGLPWEVLLVDNRSTDGSADLARALWPASPPAPLRIVREETEGVGPARFTGFRNARFDIACFVDDDNILAPDYLARALKLMSANPRAAIAGGSSELLSPVPPPSWLHRFNGFLALGTKWSEARILSGERELLWGAGMVLRLRTFDEAMRKGWKPRLAGRVGSEGCSEDLELCLVALLSGWTLLYDPALRIGHAIAPSRFHWGSLRRRVRSYGHCTVPLDPYRFAVRDERALFSHRWAVQFLGALLKLLRPRILLAGAWSVVSADEGSRALIRLEERLGRVAGLWNHRQGYDARVAEVRSAPWRSGYGAESRK